MTLPSPTNLVDPVNDEDLDGEPDEAKAEPKWNPRGSRVHQMVPMISHPALFSFRKKPAKHWVPYYGDQSLAWFVWEMRKRNACGTTALPSPFGDPTGKALMLQFLRCSPIFRQTLIEISEHLDSQPAEKDKTVVFCHFPGTGELLQMALGFLGIPSIILRSADNPDARYHRVYKEFNKDHYHKVLIVPFTLKLAGMDMHDKACKGICMEQSSNQATMEQGTKRMHRLPQTSQQSITRLYMPGTYMSRIERLMVRKSRNIELVINDSLRGAEKCDRQ